MPDLPIPSNQTTLSGECRVQVKTHPDAVTLEEREFSRLRAWICGACGFTEIYATNVDTLFEAYSGRVGEVP